jgi:zinc transport system substrate-binding protein
MRTIALIMVLTIGTAGAAAAGPPTVFVTIAPQKYFVEKVAQGRVDVRVMAPAGSDPHHYEPKPRQMAALSGAAAYFAIGVNFEDLWLAEFAAAAPDMKIFHTDRNIDKIPIAGHDHEDGGRDGERLDPHVWTSPVRVVKLAAAIRDGLAEIDPERAGEYRRGYNEFEAELNELDRRLKRIFQEKPGAKFLVFHPAWGYLAHDYGLTQVAVEKEGKSPKPARLAQLIREAREEGIEVVFVQPQTSGRSARVIADAVGGQVVRADPLAPDWKENLERAAEKFRKALR